MSAVIIQNPSLGYGEFLGKVARAGERQLAACIAGLLAGWSSLFAALWFGVLLAVVGAIAGFLGAAILTSGFGQASQAFDIVGGLGGILAGFAVGFTAVFGTTLLAGLLHAVAAIVVGCIAAVAITFLCVELEPLSLDLRSYRRPSRRANEAAVNAALARVAYGMGLTTIPGLRISDEPVPGAWTHAGTIVVSKGLIDLLTPIQLEAVLAHELHHWHSGDALGARFVWACAFPVVLLCNLRMLVARWRPWGSLINVLLWPAPVLMNWVVAPLLTAHGRTQEFEADAAAIAAGYGQELARALTKIADFEGARTGWEAAILRTHPPTEFRLEAIEEATGVAVTAS